MWKVINKIRVRIKKIIFALMSHWRKYGVEKNGIHRVYRYL